MNNQKQTVKSQVKELKENSSLKPKQILQFLTEKNVKTTLNSINYYYYYGKKGLASTNA
jgi:endonuclease III-like uncharacterized protein